MSIVIWLILIPPLLFLYQHLQKLNFFRVSRKLTRYLEKRYSNGPFLPIKEDSPLVSLAENWKSIREEANLIVKNFNVPKFYEVDPIQKQIADDKWHTLMLFAYNNEIHHNTKLCPKTTALLKKLPNLQTAMFSILQPRSHIPKHKGPLKAVLRYHLGLIVPKDTDNCFITVNSTPYHWKEGEGVIFDDTFEHSVVNNTDEIRVVLFLDIVRDDLPLWLKIFLKLIFSILPLTKWWAKGMRNSEPQARKI